jgi:hypothetical protein
MLDDLGPNKEEHRAPPGIDQSSKKALNSRGKEGSGGREG